MGEKGASRSGAADEMAERFTDALQPLGDVSARKMFGGYGIFHDGVMFALVDSAGTPHLRVDDTTSSGFEEAGSSKHDRMPYWSVPDGVMADDDQLIEWATSSRDIAHAAKKK